MMLASLGCSIMVILGVVSAIAIGPEASTGFESSEEASFGTPGPVPAVSLYPNELAPTPFSSCILHGANSSGINVIPWEPNTDYTWRVMSTVQAREYQFFAPSGFASRCDWVICSRQSNHTIWGRIDVLPRTVFVHTKESQVFNDRFLPCIPYSHRFVLIIGDEDATTPKQLDARWGPKLKPGVWDAWLDDARILHMFVEHLDTVSPEDRVTPIPVGLNGGDIPGHNPDTLLDWAPKQVLISARPLKLVFTNRIRDSSKIKGQFDDRAIAKNVCERLPYCEVASASREQYTKMLENYAFLLCIHGGGIDPNPNLFTALLAGLIPIIVGPFAGDTMYKGWPVVITDGYSNMTTDNLAQIVQEFAPYFEDPSKRAEVLRKLTSQYWWDKVERALATV